MKTNKSTKIFAILFVLLATVLTGCANGAENEETKYMVETGKLPWSYYDGFVLSFEQNLDLPFNFTAIKSWRDHFYNHTEEGDYEKQKDLSASAVKAILHQDLMPGDTPEDVIEKTNSIGNMVTFINVTVTDPNKVTPADYVTWVYIEK